jgi:hypothetical protein
MIKIYDWNAEIEEKEGQKEVKISFNIQGVNQPEKCVQVFQSGKNAIETLQSSEDISFFDYYFVLSGLIGVVIKALKKSK